MAVLEEGDRIALDKWHILHEMKMPLPEEPILFLTFNDVTDRDPQRKYVQWMRAKSFDIFAPFVPWIGKIDPSDVDIQTRVNGKVMQFISGVMTLEPGDVKAYVGENIKNL